jgi:hypothetical protein
MHKTHIKVPFALKAKKITPDVIVRGVAVFSADNRKSLTFVSADLPPVFHVFIAYFT